MATDLIKVTREGAVTRNGAIVGFVRKVDPADPLHVRGEGMGMRMSFSMKPMWFAFDNNSVQLNEIGYDTRKRAVSRVANASAPLIVDNVKLETALSSDSRQYIYASVRWEGNWASVSRYPSERAWVMDAYAPEGSFMPAFSNGGGTRYTHPHVLQGPMHNAVNDAAVAAGLLASENAIEWDELLKIAQAELGAENTD